MTNPMRESVTKEALYPDDLPQFGGKSDDHLVLVEPAPVDAGDVPVDDARYGQWIQVETGKHGEVWACAPRLLREFLADAFDFHESTDLAFQVFDAERGDADHEPWRFDARVTMVDGSKVEDGYEVSEV